MQEIEQQAMQMYADNMTYLQQMQPKLYKDLLNLDLSIQNGHYTQQYDLEYIEDNFDIKQLTTSKYMYGKKSKNISDSYTKHLSFAKDKSSIVTFAMYDVEEEALKSNEHDVRARRDIYPLMSYHIEKIDPTANMKEIVKFIFSGVGLGLHIPTIANKVKAARYLIIEDDIEIFKLSLFTTPYFEIAQKAKIYFSVLEDVDSFNKTYNEFLDEAYMYNHLLKYTHFAAHSFVKLKHIVSLTGALDFVAYPYQLQLDKHIAAFNYIKKNVPLIDIYKGINPNVISETPVLVIASGPSLSKNIDWLKQHHKKFLIVAVSSSLHYLAKYAIKPAIVVSADQQEIVKDFFIGFDDENFLDKSICIFSSITNPKVLEVIKEENRFVTDVSLQFNAKHPTYSFSCAGSFAYLFSLNLRAKQTYILGLDLAVDQETGDDHIADHISTDSLDMSVKSQLPTEMSLTKTLIPIKGNFEETVYTTPSFHMSINSINDYANYLIPRDSSVYNLNYGAHIAGAKPLDIEDIKIDTFPEYKYEEMYVALHTALSQNVESELTDEEKAMIATHTRVIKKIAKIIQKYKKKGVPKEADVYIKRVVKLSNDIYDADKTSRVKIPDIFRAYFKYVLSIIYDFFNTEDLEDIEQHIVTLDKTIVIGLENITEQFKTTYKEF